MPRHTILCVKACGRTTTTPDGICWRCRQETHNAFENEISAIIKFYQKESLRIRENVNFQSQRINLLNGSREQFSQAEEILREATANTQDALSEHSRVQAQVQERNRLAAATNHTNRGRGNTNRRVARGTNVNTTRGRGRGSLQSNIFVRTGSNLNNALVNRGRGARNATVNTVRGGSQIRVVNQAISNTTGNTGNAQLDDQEEEEEEEEQEDVDIVNNQFEEVAINDNEEGLDDVPNGHQCTICMDVVNSNAWARLPCDHEYHTQCISQWNSEGHDTCPNCRGPIADFETFDRS